MSGPSRSKTDGEWEPPLLIDALPDLAQEIRRLLVEEDEADLADQVPSLRIVDRCRCGDWFCGSFRTAPAPSGSYGPSHRNVVLDPEEGMLIPDVVDERIVYVEILYLDDIRDAVERIAP